MGEIHDRLGEPARTAHYYARALALWTDRDPGLEPQVAAARRRLEQMTAEGARGR